MCIDITEKKNKQRGALAWGLLYIPRAVHNTFYCFCFDTFFRLVKKKIYCGAIVASFIILIGIFLFNFMEMEFKISAGNWLFAVCGLLIRESKRMAFLPNSILLLFFVEKADFCLSIA